MAEISREEAIKWLEKSAPVCMCTSSEFGEFIQCVNKAISDMEKLEKIEQMIDECRAWTDDMAECLIEIEKIVKEV